MAVNKKDILDDEQYRVELTSRVEVLGNTLAPGMDIVLQGSIVKQIIDQVSHAEPV